MGPGALHGKTDYREDARGDVYPLPRRLRFRVGCEEGAGGANGRNAHRDRARGGINGFNTLIKRIVEDRHLVVLLNNTGATRLEDMSHGILDVLYGKPAALPRRSSAEAMLKTLREKGLDAAIAQYRELKRTQATGYYFEEGELNQLGYTLLQQKKTKEAVAVFQLNAEA